jgi:hypothetical protein
MYKKSPAGGGTLNCKRSQLTNPGEPIRVNAYVVDGKELAANCNNHITG